jgi:hypothetical protein
MSESDSLFVDEVNDEGGLEMSKCGGFVDEVNDEGGLEILELRRSLLLCPIDDLLL